MKNNKNRIRYITILAAVIAILSLGIGYSSYSTTNDASGTSEILKSKYDIKLDNIHSKKTSNKDITYKLAPTITGNEISFSVSNLIYNNNVSFKFDIKNEGTVKVKVKSIKVTGLDKYEKSLTYELSNIKVGDVIKSDSVIKDNEFILKYKQAILDEQGQNMNLELDNIVLAIEFEKVKE